MMKKILSLLTGFFLFLSGFSQSIVNAGNINNWDSAHAKTFPADTTYGYIYNKTYWNANDKVDFVSPAASTTTISSGTVTTTSAGNAYSDACFLTPNYQTMLAYFSDTVDFKITTFGNGLFWGRSNINGLLGYMTATSGASTIRIVQSNGTALSTPTAGPTVTINHIYEYVLTLNDTVVTFSVKDVTAAGSYSTNSYTIPLSAASKKPVMANIAFGAFTGTYVFSKIAVTSIERKNANLLVAGDSKSDGWDASSWNGGYVNQLKPVYPHVVKWTGSGMMITDLLTGTDELIRLNPQQVILNIGSNDIRNGHSLAQVVSDYTALVSKLWAPGRRIIHIVQPEDSTGGATGNGIGMTAFKNWVQATYGADYIDTIWTGLSTNNVLKAIYNDGVDGAHVNQLGHNFIFAMLEQYGGIKNQGINNFSSFTATDSKARFNAGKIELSFPVRPRAGWASIWGSNTPSESTIGTLQDNQTSAGVAPFGTAFTPMNTALFTTLGPIGTNGTIAGILIGDRGNTGANLPTATYAIYSTSGLLRLFNPAASKDILINDTTGRYTYGSYYTSSGSTPSALVQIQPTSGGAGLGQLKLVPTTILATPENGVVENSGTHLYWTNSSATRFQIDQQSGSVAGSNTQVIYNNSGSYAGSANLIFDGTATGMLHIKGLGSVPTVPGGSLGLNVTSATPSGTDGDFKLTVVASGAVTGTICTISFATAYGSTPITTFSSQDVNTGSACTLMWGGATSGSSITFGGTISGAGTYVFNFHTMGN